MSRHWDVGTEERLVSGSLIQTVHGTVEMQFGCLEGYHPTIGDRGYRYHLWAWWRDVRPIRIAWVLINPSTASATTKDPTFRRILGFGKRFGAGRIDVVNAYAMRSKNPLDMLGDPDRVGPANDVMIADVVRECEFAIIGWGTKIERQRHERVLSILRETGTPTYALHRTAEGFPGHPLYLRADSEMQPWQDLGHDPDRSARSDGGTIEP